MVSVIPFFPLSRKVSLIATPVCHLKNEKQQTKIHRFTSVILYLIITSGRTQKCGRHEKSLEIKINVFVIFIAVKTFLPWLLEKFGLILKGKP